MRQTPLTNPYKFRVNIRPIKIAYFIAADSDQLRSLVSLMCTQWGGIRHLIIALEKDYLISRLDQSLIGIHEPDRYILYDNFDKSHEPTARNSIQAQLQQLLPHRHITIESGSHFEKHSDNTAHALSIIPAAVAESRVLTLPCLTDTQSEIINTLLFGHIYPGQEEDYYKFLTTDVERVGYGTEQFWLSQMNLDPFSSVLNLTSYQIGAYNVSGGWNSFDHFDLIVCDSTNDYAFFWNMRALRECIRFHFEEEDIRRTLLLPVDLLDKPDNINTLFEIISQKLFRPV